MIPPPDQDDVDAQMLFQEWREKSGRQDFDVFQLLEVLAFRLKLYAPIHYRPVDGLSWPQFFRAPDDENKTITHLFTKKAVVEKFLANDPQEHQRYLTLSGIEAMRWIWAAPKNIDTIAIDYHPNSPAWLTFPNHWALSAIHPLFYDVPDMRKVPSAPLADLGGLPGRRGLKPEVVRALVLGWKQLFCYEGETPVRVEHQGKRYLPVFSSAEQLLAFSSSPGAPPGKPKPLDGGRAPFREWLEATADSGGVLLDPVGPRPLPLDHTDLLVLSLRADRTALAPHGWDIVRAVGELLDEGKISAALAAQMVADYPRYWVGLKQTDDGGGALLMVPQTDACALFTSSDSAKRYLDFYMGADALRSQLQGMEPVPLLSRWQVSAVSVAAGQFSEMWIDPDVLGRGAVAFGREGMEAARARIDEKLKPRVPGFVWEA